MDSDVRFMFDLIGSAVFDLKAPVQPEETDWQKIYLLSKKHSISNIICYGILKGNYKIPESYLGMFRQDMFANLNISENQAKEINALTEEFSKNGIDFLCLKGTVLKNFYPSPDMRRMGDADILIRKESYPEADGIMKKLGYEFVLESDHEYVYHKHPVTHVELHKFLIPSYNDDMYSYYGSGWDIAKKKEDGGHEYELGDNDNFVYLITHLAKHYRDGGIGIKSFIDIELYRRTKAPDMNYVYEQLEKLGLKKFAENIFALLKVWFGDGKENGLLEDMTEYILSSGEYGSRKNKDDVAAIRDYESDSENFDKIRQKKIMSAVFPPLEIMKKIFPFLEKAPVFLPAFWVIRWIRGVFRPKSRQNLKNITENITSDNMREYAGHMDSVGLDIYNGRK